MSWYCSILMQIRLLTSDIVEGRSYNKRLPVTSVQHQQSHRKMGVDVTPHRCTVVTSK